MLVVDQQQILLDLFGHLAQDKAAIQHHYACVDGCPKRDRSCHDSVGHDQLLQVEVVLQSLIVEGSGLRGWLLGLTFRLGRQLPTMGFRKC